jgi:hypothetical protein
LARLRTLIALLRTSRTRLGTLRTTLRSLQRLTVLSVGLKVIAVFELLPAPLTYKPIRILSHISPFMLLGTDSVMLLGIDSGAKSFCTSHSFPIQILPLPGRSRPIRSRP